MEWVEVQAKSVDEAVAMAVKELGVASVDDVTIEILQEPKSGFLGVGRQEALVKVTPKPKPAGQRRRRRRGRGRGRGEDRSEDGGSAGSGSDRRPSEKSSGRQDDRSKSKSRQSGRSKNDAQSSDRRPQAKERKPMKPSNDTPTASIEEQGDVAKAFIVGLLEALGLEGEVTTRIDGDLLYIDVAGDQTEALVGPKGSTLQALHELTRTVIQRKTFGAPRMRLDVAGYTERRREALRIYATKLADRVSSSGEEVMLEPMNAADRKVVHDAIVEIAGVVSFSEGEEPNRAVVLAPDPDAPRPAPQDDASEGRDDDNGDDDNGDDDNGDDEAE